MQVAAQAAALLLARRDEALAGALQVGGEPDGVDRDPGLPGQVVEQARVGSNRLGPGGTCTTKLAIVSPW